MSKIPTVSILSQSKKVISDEAGMSQCVCVFNVDMDAFQWEARAVRTNVEPKRGEGEIVEKGIDLKAGENGTVYVDYNELQHGDGIYTISIYAQAENGYWSDGTFVQLFRGAKYNSKRRYNSKWYYNCIRGEKIRNGN